MLNMKELNKELTKGKLYNTNVSIRAVEENDEYLVVKAIANKFLDANGTPVEDNHGTILTQATLDTSAYMRYNSVVLAHHNGERPVGKVTNLDMKEDGLEVILEVYKDNDAQIFNQVKRGTLNGLSVGMYILESEYSELLDSVIIRKAELAEISLVTNPSNPLSFIEAVDMCSMGVCSAIRSTERKLEERSVDKEAFKAIIKDMVENGELDLTKHESIVEPEVDPIVEPEVDPIVEPEVDPEVEPEVEPEVDPEVEPEVDPEVEPEVEPEVDPEVEPEVEITKDNAKDVIKEIFADAGNDIILPNVSFEDRLEDAAQAFANKEEGAKLTPEQVNLLSFIVMNYGSIEDAVKQHLE